VNVDMPMLSITNRRLVSLRNVCRRLSATTITCKFASEDSIRNDFMYFGSFIKENCCFLASQVYGDENVLFKPARRGKV
jgi:hypothetical protein